MFQAQVKEMIYDLNHFRPFNPKRQEIISRLVSGNSKFIFIEDGFHCTFCKNIRFKGVAMINVGNYALIGSNCNKSFT